MTDRETPLINSDSKTEPAYALSVTNLRFSYGAIPILRDVTMHLPKGEVTCLMGRNGVGKTTFLNNLVGTLSPSSGTVNLNGTDVTQLPAHRRTMEGIAIVPQGRKIFPSLTVKENLSVALAGNRHRSRFETAFDVFPDLKPLAHRMGGNLSGGQQQQLAIARALMTGPEVLILDEPTEGIQPNIVQRIGQTLRILTESCGVTILLVEQYVSFVREFGEQVYFMRRGRIVDSVHASSLTGDIANQYLGV